MVHPDVGPSLGVSLVTWQPRPGVRPGEEVLPRGRGHRGAKQRLLSL